MALEICLVGAGDADGEDQTNKHQIHFGGISAARCRPVSHWKNAGIFMYICDVLFYTLL